MFNENKKIKNIFQKLVKKKVKYSEVLEETKGEEIHTIIYVQRKLKIKLTLELKLTKAIKKKYCKIQCVYKESFLNEDWQDRHYYIAEYKRWFKTKRICVIIYQKEHKVKAEHDTTLPHSKKEKEIAQSIIEKIEEDPKYRLLFIMSS